MSTGKPNTPPAKVYVPCPKCYGAKYFSCWSHIAAGACFCCAGNGDVEMSRAIQFGYVAPAKPSKNVKEVDLGRAFGFALITKVAGGFRVQWGSNAAGERSGGVADFRVVNGKIVDLDLSDSPRRLGYGPALLSALQAALKV